MLDDESKENIELEYHADFRTLEVRWLHPLNQDTFTSLWRTIITEASRYKVENIILDSTFVHAEKKHLLHEALFQPTPLPKLDLPNIMKVAWIRSGETPDDHEKSNHYQALLKEYFPAIQFNSFAHHYEALYWLE